MKGWGTRLEGTGKIGGLGSPREDQGVLRVTRLPTPLLNIVESLIEGGGSKGEIPKFSKAPWGTLGRGC